MPDPTLPELPLWPFAVSYFSQQNRLIAVSDLRLTYRGPITIPVLFSPFLNQEFDIPIGQDIGPLDKVAAFSISKGTHALLVVGAGKQEADAWQAALNQLSTEWYDELGSKAVNLYASANLARYTDSARDYLFSTHIAAWTVRKILADLPSFDSEYK